ncbi:FecR family protein [Dyella acidisoli]|uniref:Transcriptional regulator n=1 Tax=Dyella acidisoli TaxID=1867834 RepID=A0ABQ5XR81_9GAMM|nr:FecR domain-containing protein [Dyella acidisoli]GLQ93000.1 transcriptional regulator [Dyella acidisoli]
MANQQQEEIVQTAADWWVRLREPNADGDTVEQWLAWTAEDERHLEAFERMNAFAERLGHLDRVSRQALINAFARPVPPRRHWLPLAAAASIAVVVLSGAVYYGWAHFASGDTTQTYQSAVAQNRSFSLPDGTKVALGAASTLTVHYGRDRRSVELRGGEAFFDVVHDNSRPFVVTAGDVSVHDIGTAFDVRRTGERVMVAVTQGRVEIADLRTGASQRNTLEATAGQRVSFDPNASGMAVDTMATEQVTAWRNDRLEFIDEPLGVVIANLNRYTSKPVHIVDADLNKLTYTGTVRTDAIDSWVGALPEVFPLRVSKETDQIMLSDARHAEQH